MIKVIFLMFICHFIGDYYLQSNKIAGRKAKSYRNTLLHCLYYLVPFIFVEILIFKAATFELFYLFLITLSHAVVDLSKLTLLKKENGNKLSYILDQICHSFFIIFITLLFQNRIEITSELYLSKVSLDSLKMMLLCVYMGQPHFITDCILFFKEIKPSNFFGLKYLWLKLFSIIEALLFWLNKSLLFIMMTGLFFIYIFSKEKNNHDYINIGLTTTFTIILVSCLFKTF